MAVAQLLGLFVLSMTLISDSVRDSVTQAGKDPHFLQGLLTSLISGISFQNEKKAEKKSSSGLSAGLLGGI
jgi:hypothetical protein